MAAALALCSCIGPVKPPATIPVDWSARQVQLSEIERWGLRGRAGVRIGEEGLQIRMHWQQHGAQDYTLRFYGPLGRGGVLIGDARGIELQTGSGETYRGSDAEQLMQEHLGWSVPLAGLSFWMRGLPYPHRPFELLHLDKRERLSRLHQDGWQVSIGEYTVQDGHELPARLQAENGALRVRLAVDRWQLAVP